MANQKRADDADLWFVTAEGSCKLRDLEHAPCELGVLQTGLVRMGVGVGYRQSSRDRNKIKELYEPDWKAWFGQEGEPRHGTPDDPRVVLIGINVHAAVSRSQQTEARCPLRTGEGLAHG
jgi:general stress protein 26